MKIRSSVFCLLLTACLFPALVCTAQNKDTKTTSTAQERIFYGGNIGFNFSSDAWMLNISPLIGYRFTPSLSGGVSFLYEYENYSKYTPGYNINSYGGGAFLRYDLGPALMKDMPFSIFFQTDYEGRQEEYKYKNRSDLNTSIFQNRLYLGAGYAQSISARSRVFFMVSVDVLHLNETNVRPVIRAGFEL